MKPSLRPNELVETTIQLFKKVLGIDQQVFWLGIVMLAFLSVLAVSGPLPGETTTAPASPTFTPTFASTLLKNTQATLLLNVSTNSPSLEPPTPTSSGPTPTPFPPELVANREQTNGIILGTVVLVLIIVVGTLASIRSRSKE